MRNGMAGLALVCVMVCGGAGVPASAQAAAQATAAPASAQLTEAERARVQADVADIMKSTSVPSVSVGVARGGDVVYTQAFGDAKLPRNVGVASGQDRGLQIAEATTKAVPANVDMAYPIGSNSKQFTAACILLLQERGKLKLDDPLSKWFPEFTRSNEVKVRNLLTHTSGYSDYAPQDYTIPAWTKPIDPMTLLHEWATKPLDFDPGTKWQYSNTNFVIAAMIIEKITGEKFHDFLWANVIEPLKLQGVLDLDTQRDQLKVRGYEQHALGAMRPAILEAPGWYYGDAQLAMPVRTLLQWDMSIAHKTLLKPESYTELETPFLLKDGTNTHYGLGVDVNVINGKRVVSHSGEVGGFVSENVVLPDDGVAVATLTNEEASSAAHSVAADVLKVIEPAVAPVAEAKPAPKPATPARDPEAPPLSAADSHAETEVSEILMSFQQGRFSPAPFTPDAQFYFSPETVEDFHSSLAAAGKLVSVTQTSSSLRGGMVFRSYRVQFADSAARLTTFTTKDGKIEQFLVAPAG